MLDYVVALLFWALYEVLSWPLRLALIPAPMSHDLRRMISRVAGPAMIAFAAWVAAHFFIPLHFVTIWIWWGLAAGCGWLACRAAGGRIDVRSLLTMISPIANRRRWKRELFIELFSLLIFFSYLAFRRWAPEMTTVGVGDGSGAEKFANAMFFWSSWHARWLPLDDYWLTGNTQVYYYWGHYFWAWVGRAGGFPAPWVITLALARLVQLIWESSYLLVRAFGARPISACLGALFITWGGDPQGVVTAFKQYDSYSGRVNEPLESRGFAFAPRYLERAAKVDWDAGHYQFWEPSRVIGAGSTVNEFPAWSAVLGDFHAHHISLPWLIGWLALILGGARWFGLGRAFSPRGPPLEGEQAPKTLIGLRWDRIGPIATWMSVFIVIGALAAFSNLWVAPLIVIAAFGIFFWPLGRGRTGILVRAAAIGALIVLLGTLAVVSRGSVGTPFPDAPSGDEVSLLEKLPLKVLPKDIRSPFSELFRLWGHQGLVLVMAFIAATFTRRFSAMASGWMALGAAALLLKFFILPNEAGLYWIAMLAAVATLGCGARPWLKPMPTMFGCGACLLLGGLELFYIQDRFGDGLYARYNSYFKFCYPAWPIMTAAAWMGAQKLWRLRVPRPILFVARGALLALVPSVMAFAFFGAAARNVQAATTDVRPRKPTLNAFSWLDNRAGYESEAQMLEWVRRNVPAHAVVVEAAFDVAYKYNGRLASLAGRPVPLGWKHHEDQWRGVEANAKLAGENERKVRAIYEAPDPQRMRQAVEDSGYAWVVLGKNEIEHYGPERAESIYAVMRQAGELRAMFPAEGPEVFVFEFPSAD